MARLKRALISITLALVVAACATVLHKPPTVTVLYAQSLPATVHAHWSPNAVADNITSYKVTLDGGTAEVALPMVCSATDCVVAVTVPAYGAHSIALVSENLKLSGDPTSVQGTPQDSNPVVVAFALNPPPGSTAGGRVTN